MLSYNHAVGHSIIINGFLVYNYTQAAIPAGGPLNNGGMTPVSDNN